MSLSIKYESVDDANMRLKHTVVLYNGLPHYINGVFAPEARDGIFRVKAQPLPYKGVAPKYDRNGDPIREDEIKKYISSKHFDISPFPMGYLNDPKMGAIYCTRAPHRQNKQGLSENTLILHPLTGGGMFGWNQFITSPGTVAMVTGDYPSIKKALELLAKAPSIAFHREFALVKDEILPNICFLYHKNKKVGAVMDGDIVLGDAFKYLKETLQEAGVKVKG